MRNRVISIFVSAILITGFFAGYNATPANSETQKFLIGYSQILGSHPFVLTLTEGAKDACEEWKQNGYDVELIFTDGGSSDFATKQIADMEDLAAQNIDCLLVFPGDSQVVGEAIESIYNANNIPVVVTDIGVSKGEYISFLITDNYTGGGMAAELMASRIPEGAKVIAYNSAPGRENARLRVDGFMDKAKELGLTVLNEIPSETSVEDGRKSMEDLLTSTPDIGGVFHLTVTPAIGALSALGAAGNTSCIVVTFDLDKVTFDMVADGSLAGCVIQDPYFMGHEGFNQAMYYLTGQSDKVRKDIPSPTSLLTIDNLEDFRDNIQASM